MYGPAFQFGITALTSLDPEVLKKTLRHAAFRQEEYEEFSRGMGAALTRGFQDSRKTAPGIISRKACALTLTHLRSLGNVVALEMGSGVHSAASFWRGAIGLMHLPHNERRLVDWLLATQDEHGAVHARMNEPDPLDLLEADLYTALRAIRLYRWTYDGEGFLRIADSLEKTLAHAQSLCGENFQGLSQLAAAYHPARGAAGPSSLALALLGACQGMSSIYAELGLQEAAERLRTSFQNRSDRLFQSTQNGGFWNGHALEFSAAEDPLEQAVGLLLHGFPEAQAQAFQSLLEEQLLKPGDSLEENELLWVRALLQRGNMVQGQALFRRASRAIERVHSPFAPNLAGYYDALVFGLLGILRLDLGTIAVHPRISTGTSLSSSLALPEGSVNFQVSAVQGQGARMLRAENRSKQALMLEFGVPRQRPAGSTRTEAFELALVSAFMEPGELWSQQVSTR
jgi:hypothetical protein